MCEEKCADQELIDNGDCDCAVCVSEVKDEPNEIEELIQKLEGTLLGDIINNALGVGVDFLKARDDKNKKAGTRVRLKMIAVKTAAHELRKEVLTFRGK